MLGKNRSQITAADIESAAATLFTAYSSILPPEHSPLIEASPHVNVFDEKGEQICRADGTPVALPHEHVLVANLIQNSKRGVVCHPSKTLASSITPHSLSLAASRVFAITNDGYLLLGVRAETDAGDPLRMFDSVSGIRGPQSAKDYHETARDCAYRSLKNGLGIAVPPDQFELVSQQDTLEKFPQYHHVHLRSGRVVIGFQPTRSDIFVMHLPFSSAQIRAEVALSEDYDSVVLVSFKNADALRFLSGSVAEVKAKLYFAERRLSGTFANYVRAPLSAPTDVGLVPSDCMLNRSSLYSRETSAILANHFGIPSYR